jgi:hypothetical protein
MSGQLLDFVQTQSFDNPIAQAGTSQIVEGAGSNAGPSPDLN